MRSLFFLSLLSSPVVFSMDKCGLALFKDSIVSGTVDPLVALSLEIISQGKIYFAGDDRHPPGVVRVTPEEFIKLPGTALLLISPEQFLQLPNGTLLTSLDGEIVEKGRDKINLETRGGVIAFGVQKSVIDAMMAQHERVTEESAKLPNE